MTVTVQWLPSEEFNDGRKFYRCLYAYLAPKNDEILYIGKSWGVSVRSGWVRSAKPDFWDALEMERGIFHHRSIVGVPLLPKGGRLTKQLLGDIESLMIYVEQPWGNIQSCLSRIERPGLGVRCVGDWPGRNTYRDV